MNEAAWDEQWGPIARRAHAAARAARWSVRGAFGLPRTILVELRWRLGDEIMALPVIDALHERHPDARLTVLTNHPELFADRPSVNAVNAPPPRVDRYILLRGAPRNVYRLDHYARRARIPTPAAPPRLVLSSWDTPLAADLPPHPRVAFAPGASWSTKRWRAERWRELGELLRARGMSVVELGCAGEATGAGIDLTGRTSVCAAACLLRQMDALVCCDSGLMHLGLAAGTPVIALFGPTDPNLYVRAAPGFHPIRSTQDCAGHWNHAPAEPRPGVCPSAHACCLDSIDAATVWGRLSRLLRTM